MNIYKSLNDITNYIENNLDKKIDYTTLSKFLGVNTYTMQRIFSLLVGTTLADYIRKRRLSKAAGDLAQGDKVIDVALKYGYENATSFSRAFESFHNVKPSKIDNLSKLKNFPQIIFEEKEYHPKECDYEIVHLKKMVLYGFKTETSNKTITKDAPEFFQKIEKKYGSVKYATVTYDETRQICKYYYVLYDVPILDAEKVVIPENDYLVFRINSQEATEIQQKSQEFYLNFWPSCNYNFNGSPEIEYYHDGVTDFLVPIILTDKTGK